MSYEIKVLDAIEKLCESAVLLERLLDQDQMPPKYTEPINAIMTLLEKTKPYLSEIISMLNEGYIE